MSNDAMYNQLKYEEAIAQLETIVRKMEANEFDIDELAVQLKTAQRLIKFCKDKLTKTEDELRKIQSESE
jgi:exodeoxyribonuclease VII small subunit